MIKKIMVQPQNVQLLIFIMCSCVSSLLLIISTFNGNLESTVMEMALTQNFCSYYMNKIWKDTSLLIGNFHYQITA